MRTYAIGDIHGHLDALDAAHARVEADRRRVGDDDAPLVHLGDLVDRGPESAGVVRTLMEGIAAGRPWEVILGNHDRGFLRWLTGTGTELPLPEDYWSSAAASGFETCASYGVEPSRDPAEVLAQARELVPETHLAFLRNRPLTVLRDGVLFVHAGIRPGVPLEAQTEDDLVWIREPFLSDRRDHGVLVVHGHTALPTAAHFGNRVDLDSSVAFGGHLTAAVIEDGEVFLLERTGREPLRP